MSDTLNVYQRMVKACEILGSQAWEQDLSNATYKSITIDTMRARVRSACVEAGIIHVGPCDIDLERIQNPSKNTVHFYASAKFRIINADNPSEVIEYETLGEAMDNGDKGTGKVVTNLIKNFYKAAFDIGALARDDIDSYTNEEFYEETDRINSKAPKKAAPDPKEKQRKILIETMTDWAWGKSANTIIAGIVGRYAGQHGQMDTWTSETVKACYDECLKAREGSQ